MAISRRNITKATAWSVPVITTALAVPAQAASGTARVIFNSGWTCTSGTASTKVSGQVKGTFSKSQNAKGTITLISTLTITSGAGPYNVQTTPDGTIWTVHWQGPLNAACPQQPAYSIFSYTFS